MDLGFIRRNLFDSIVILFLIVSITGMINWIASFIGVSYVSLGIFGIAFLGFYMLVNLRILLSILSTHQIYLFLVFFLFLPTISLLFSEYPFSLKTFAVYLYSIQYIIVFIVLTIKFPLRIIGFIGGAALLISIFGALLSYYYPSMFDVQFDTYYLKLDRKTSFEMGTRVLGRAFGFFLEPNVLAHAIVMFSVVYASFYKTRYAISKIFILGLTIVTLFLVGSRGGILIAVCTYSILFFYYINNGMHLSGNVISKNVLFYLGVMVLAFASIIPFLHYFNPVEIQALSESSKSYEDPVTRVVRIFLGDVSDNQGENTRIPLMKHYVSETSKRPIGAGLFSMEFNYFRNSQRIGVSHNEFLRIGYELGYIYLIIFMLYYASQFLLPNKWRLYNAPPFIMLAFVAISLGCMFTATVSTERAYAFIFGVFIALKIMLSKGNVVVE